MGKITKFIETAGLYFTIQVEDKNHDELSRLFQGYGSVEVYCPQCYKDRIFKRPTTYGNTSRKDKEVFNEVFRYSPVIEQYNFECTNDSYHKLHFTIMCHKDGEQMFLTKVGQHPSFTDLSRPIFNKYKKLKGNYYKDLNRATGLFDSGIGIGSFIYLRRIIESLIIQAGERAVDDKKITKYDFEYRKTKDGKEIRNTVVEKITKLRGYLPDIMVDNPKLYSIVSKGVHELTEKECIKYFPALQTGILMILDDMLSMLQREEDEKKYRDELANIIGEIK